MIPGRGTEVPHSGWQGQKINKTKPKPTTRHHFTPARSAVEQTDGRQRAAAVGAAWCRCGSSLHPSARQTQPAQDSATQPRPAPREVKTPPQETPLANVRSDAAQDGRTVETIKRLPSGGRTSELWRALAGPLGTRKGGVQTHATAGEGPDTRGCAADQAHGAHARNRSETPRTAQCRGPGRR